MTSTLNDIETLHHLIGGEAISTATRTGAVYNPATGEQTGTLPFADATTLEHAVDIAAAALPGWTLREATEPREIWMSDDPDARILVAATPTPLGTQ
ncbi:aldehyde dehydrogenase family protein, partial [Corynebacterium variabile]|uniref:aldehyde dehydrogenase family protein n=1 Tax=Corynebacterium variabile TaxID=1727 RepID=UPI003A91C8E9